MVQVMGYRAKCGLTLTQRRMHRILYYLATEKPRISEKPDESTPPALESYIEALHLLPAFGYITTRSVPVKDPVVALCLFNLALDIPLGEEEEKKLQGCISFMSNRVLNSLYDHKTNGRKPLENLPRIERWMVTKLLAELKSKVDKIKSEGKEVVFDKRLICLLEPPPAEPKTETEGEGKPASS